MSHSVFMSTSNLASSSEASKQQSQSTPNFIKKGQLDLTPFADSKSGENGRRRAAKLLLALGPEEAAKVLQQLDASEVELIMHEVAQIDRIDSEEQQNLLKEFGDLLQEKSSVLQGGMEQARKFLEASNYSQTEMERIMRKVNHRDLYEDFAFLETIEPPILATVLSQEHHQVVAVALSYLKPKISAEVMRNLPQEFCSKVALGIAKAAKIHPESIQRMAQILREKFENRKVEKHSEVGGTQSLAQIMNHLDRDYESKILKSIEKNTPEIAKKVKEHLYTFEELLTLSLPEMQLLLSHISDNKVLATALRGAKEDIRLHFFNSMSQNRAVDILDEIEFSGPIPVKKSFQAKRFILNIARNLDEDGSIHIKKDKEEDYV